MFARGSRCISRACWDTEISDTAGNLIENDHLRLFDFLLAELKKRSIKTIVSIAFWGNGYPERDEATIMQESMGKEDHANDTAMVHRKTTCGNSLNI